MALIARLGDGSSHGGTIVTSSAFTRTEGALTARKGDLHSCPIPGHGVTPIINGALKFFCEGSPVAYNGVITGCGAVIIAGSTQSNVGDEAPVAYGAGHLGGPEVLAPSTSDAFPFILG